MEEINLNNYTKYKYSKTINKFIIFDTKYNKEFCELCKDVIEHDNNPSYTSMIFSNYFDLKYTFDMYFSDNNDDDYSKLSPNRFNKSVDNIRNYFSNIQELIFGY